MDYNKNKKFFIRYRSVAILSLSLILVYLGIILNSQPFLLSVFIVLWFLFLPVLLGYHLSVDNGVVREMFFGKVLREIKVAETSKIVKRLDEYDYWAIIFSIITRTGYIPGGYQLIGTFKYKRRFPLISVDYKFLDALISLNSGLAVDKNFTPVISEHSRKITGLELSKSDKVANIIGYVLCGILGLFLVLIILRAYGQKFSFGICAGCRGHGEKIFKE